MSATDELRRMLDERGVEWGNIRNDGSKSDYLTEWQFDGIEGHAIATEWAVGQHLTVCISHPMTPEQAVTATLGRDNVGRYVGLRQGEYWKRTENSDYYCGGCGWKVTDHDSYCPECGGALHKAALGSFNCTDSERTDGTCHADETEHVDISWQDGRRLTIHVMECSECGGTYEHINGDYEFCPRCGRKVVDDG